MTRTKKKKSPANRTATRVNRSTQDSESTVVGKAAAGAREDVAKAQEVSEAGAGRLVRLVRGFRDLVARKLGEPGLWSLRFLVVTVQRLVMALVLYAAATMLVTYGYGQLSLAIAHTVGISPATAMIDTITFWAIPALGGTILLSLAAAWIGKHLWLWNERQVAKTRTWIKAADELPVARVGSLKKDRKKGPITDERTKA